VQEIALRSLELSYPVVGTVKLARKASTEEPLLVADTYFNPLMEAALKALWSRGTPAEPPPRLLTMWQTREGAFDVEGGVHDFDPADGLVPLLKDAAPFLPVLPTDKLSSVDGGIPASLEEARLALLAFLEAGVRASATMTVEDLP
jgi:hypothetical protein